MSTSTLQTLGIVAVVCVVGYILFIRKPTPPHPTPPHPVERRCIITFLAQKNALLVDVSDLYTFLLDFAKTFGDMKTNISRVTDPLLIKLQSIITLLQSIHVTSAQQVMLYSTNIANNFKNFNYIVTQSPNLEIMNNNRNYAHFASKYVTFIQQLFSNLDKIAYNTNCHS